MELNNTYISSYIRYKRKRSFHEISQNYSHKTEKYRLNRALSRLIALKTYEHLKLICTLFRSPVNLTLKIFQRMKHVRGFLAASR